MFPLRAVHRRCLGLLVAIAGSAGCWVVLGTDLGRGPPLERATLLMQGGDPAGAIPLLQEAASETPDDAELWDALAAAHALCGEPDLAVLARQRAVDLTPDDTALRSRLAEDFVAARDLASAERELSRLVHIDTARKRALARRSQVRAKRGLLVAALGDLEALFAADVRRPERLLDAAVIAWVLANGARSKSLAQQSVDHAADALEQLEDDEPRATVAALLADGATRSPGAREVELLRRRIGELTARAESGPLPLAATVADRRVALLRLLEKGAGSEVDDVVAVLAPLIGRYPQDPVALAAVEELGIGELAPSSTPEADPADLIALAERHRAAGRHGMAFDALEAARWLAPLDVALLASHGAAVARLPAGAGSDVLLDLVAAERPGTGWGAFHRACAVATAGDPVRAHELWKKAVELSPSQVTFRETLRRSALRLGDHDVARSMTPPADTEAVAELAIAERDWDLARAKLMELVTLRPDDAELAERLARVELARGDAHAALARIERATPSPRSRLLRARAELVAGRLDDARTTADELVSSYPVEARMLLAQIHERRDEPKRVLEELRVAVQSATNRSDAHIALAEVEVRRVGLEPAIYSLSSLVQGVPGDWAARHALARLLDRAGRHEQASEQYLEAIREAPAPPIALRNDFAWNLGVHRGELKSALAQVGRARRVSPRDPELLDTEGTVRLLLGEAQVAADLLADAAERLPSRADIAARHSQALRRLGRVEEASAEHSRGRAIDANAFDEAHSLVMETP